MSRLRTNWLIISLVLILLLAVGLRLYGVNFGLPYVYHPDEWNHIDIVGDMLRQGVLNPHWFKKPSLYFYLLALAYIVYFPFSVMQGKSTSLSSLAETIVEKNEIVADPLSLLWARIFFAFFGVLTVLAVYLIARRFHNRYVGLLAALFLAVAPIHAVLQFHAVNADAPMIFSLVLSLAFCSLALETGRERDYALAGLFIGLATSVKYNGLVAGILLFATYILTRGKPKAFRNLVIGLASIGVGFLLGTPFAVLTPQEFFKGATGELIHYTGGHVGQEGSSWLFYARTLFHDAGELMLALGITGVVLAFRRREKREILLAVFCLVYYLWISLFRVHFDRIAAPLVPFLVLLSAKVIWLAVEACVHRLNRYALGRPLVYGFLALVVIVLPVYRTVQRDYLLSQTDVRTIALEWARENIPPGSKVAIEPYCPPLGTLPLDITILKGTGNILGGVAKHPPEWYQENGFDYLVVSSGRYSRLFRDPERYAKGVARYEAIFKAFPLAREFVGPLLGTPDGVIRIYQVPPPEGAKGYNPEDYRSIGEELDSLGKEGDGVVIVPPEQVEVLAQYLRKDIEIYPLPREGASSEEVERELREVISQHGRIFSVFWDEGGGESVNLVEGWLNENAYRAWERWYGGVRLVIFGTSFGEEGVYRPLRVRLGDKIILEGYRLIDEEVRAGDIIRLVFHWRSEGEIGERYKIFVHLLDEEGKIVAQRDSEPIGGMRPTIGWELGEEVVDRYGVLVGEGTPSGRYELVVGIYEPQSGERLPIVDEDGVAIGDRVSLGMVEVDG